MAAATRVLPSSHRTPACPHALKSLTPSSTSTSLHLPPKSSSVNHGLRVIQVRSEIKSFQNSQNWTIEADRFPFLTHSPSSVPMAASTSAAKTAKKVCLFYCAETKALAERVASQSDSIELRSIAWRY